MRLYQNNIAKKAASLLLVGLLILVHVVKVLHAHPHEVSDPSQKGGIKSICAVCDYHFVKDLDGCPTISLPKAPLTQTIIPAEKSKAPGYSTRYATALRGPPTT